VLIARRDQVEADLAQLAPSAPCAHTVARLRCLRGIDTLSALGLCAEIGEWERFDHPDQLAAYVGIVPSDHTTGQQRRLGAITNAGSTHARRLIIEAAHHYRRGPWSARRSSDASAAKRPRSSTSPGAQRRLNARSPAQRRPTQTQRHRRGRDRPRTRRLLLGDRHLDPPLIPTVFRRHPCPRATPSHSQPPTPQARRRPPPLARDSPTHANPSPHPVAAGAAARASRLAHTSSAICRLSTRHRRPRSTLDSGRATNQGLGVPQAPNMSMTTVANPRTPGPPRQPQPHTPKPQPTHGHQPLPLDTRPSIWATKCRSPMALIHHLELGFHVAACGPTVIQLFAWFATTGPRPA